MTARGRWYHALTSLMALAGLVVQFVLIWIGPGLEPVSRGVRVWRFFSYFTIQSNVLVLVGTAALAATPLRDGTAARVLRLDGLVGIVTTALVHWVFLRPLQDLAGLDYAVDKVLHVVVPVLALLGWVVVGPRRRISLRVVLLALIWPVAWLGYTLLVGAATGWYPYPFLDVGVHGPGSVAVSALAVAANILVLSALFGLVDRLLPAGRSPARGRA